jgi:hypothetical protein
MFVVVARHGSFEINSTPGILSRRVVDHILQPIGFKMTVLELLDDNIKNINHNDLHNRNLY